MLTGAQHLQNIHPLIIHFPIAFIWGAVLFYFLSCIFRKDAMAVIGFSMLILGGISLVLAVGTGLYAEPGVMISRSVRANLLLPHKHFMLLTSGLCMLVLIWAVIGSPFPKKGRLIFLALLIVILGLMTWGADFGARLVYDYNAGGNACRQPIEFTK